MEFTVKDTVYFIICRLCVTHLFFAILFHSFTSCYHCLLWVDLFKKIFCWRIVTLQHCAGFCHTSTWLSHRYIHIPSPWTPFPAPSPPHASRLSEHRLWAPCIIRQGPAGCLSCMWWRTYFHAALSKREPFVVAEVILSNAIPGVSLCTQLSNIK